MSRNILLFYLTAASLINIVNAQVDPEDIAYETDVTRRGSTAGAMLEIGVGARAEAMGGAFVAIAEDPSALYWNPAGITKLKNCLFKSPKQTGLLILTLMLWI
jgi:hypothetical protein